MANILLVDPDEVARKAMKGLLGRGNHRLAVVSTIAEAWEFARENVAIDLLITELRLKEGDGIDLIRKFHSHLFLKHLPIVVYTAHGDRNRVKSALELHVQNILLKPFREALTFAEIKKACQKAWLHKHFQHEATFCQKKGLSSQELQALQSELQATLETTKAYLKERIREKAATPFATEIKKLAVLSSNAGAIGALAALKLLFKDSQDGNWESVAENLDLLDFSSKAIFAHLNPIVTPLGFQSQEEREQEKAAETREWWKTAPEQDRCPMIGRPQLEREIDKLDGCPVIDSIAASFQMSATGHPTSLNPLLDLVTKDPGLTAHILIASNRLKKKGDDDASEAIEEPRIAISLLGEVRLVSIGSSLDIIDETSMDEPPHCNWPSFRRFQLGTANMARFICQYLEMPGLESAAYTAGLLHDIGKLLLMRLHPSAFPVIQSYANENGIKLAAAERKFLDTTTHEMATYFAEKKGLPQRFVNVLRWMDSPQDAVLDSELVSIVSLARDLCRHYHVGFSGDSPVDDTIPLEETQEWHILSHRVFLNFDLKKFERMAENECRRLRLELMGLDAN